MNTDVYTHSHAHVHTKPPSGQGLTMTLKGLCLATVIATPQAGYVVSTSTLMPLCFFMSTSVRVTAMYGVNSCRYSCMVTWGFVCMCNVAYVRTTKRQQRFHQQSSGKQNNCAFDAICLWWWGDRKWDHAEGSGCVRMELIEEQGQARRRIQIAY